MTKLYGLLSGIYRPRGHSEGARKMIRNEIECTEMMKTKSETMRVMRAKARGDTNEIHLIPLESSRALYKLTWFTKFPYLYRRPPSIYPSDHSSIHHASLWGEEIRLWENVQYEVDTSIVEKKISLSHRIRFSNDVKKISSHLSYSRALRCFECESWPHSERIVPVLSSLFLYNEIARKLNGTGMAARDRKLS